MKITRFVSFDCVDGHGQLVRKVHIQPRHVASIYDETPRVAHVVLASGLTYVVQQTDNGQAKERLETEA